LTRNPGNCSFVPRISVSVQADNRDRANALPKHVLQRFSNGRQVERLNLFTPG
jgi:hypothetical protein